MRTYGNSLQTTRFDCTYTHIHARISHDYLLFNRVAPSFRTSIGKSTGHRKLFKHIHGMIYAQFKITRQSPQTLHYTIKARTLMKKYRNGLQTTRIACTHTHLYRRIIDDYLLFDRIAQSFRTSIGKITGRRKLILHIHGTLYVQFKMPRLIQYYSQYDLYKCYI